MSNAPLTRELLVPVEYLRNRAKDMLRRWIPAHRRFLKEGQAFLSDGEREVRELPSLVQAGTIAVDVGAHIGSYTYALCQHVGSTGKVIAVEPIPDLARMLVRAAAHLKLPITVLNCALSSTTGEADLLVPMNRGKRVLGFATLERRTVPGKFYHVPMRRLDDICQDQTGRISFIKIDVEGHELHVLRGGVETLQRHRPNLLIEIEQRHSSVPISETFRFLTSLGYEGEFLDPGGRHLPLDAFDVDEHQTRKISRIGTPDYVSNFIFRPGSAMKGRNA